MSRRKSKSDQRADTRGGGFTGLPHVVHDSDAYRHLDLWARAVLAQVIRRFNGYNNGKIAISQREIADELRTTNFRKVGRAIADLMGHGLLDVAADGRWKERQAREYRLTFISTSSGGAHRPATNEYLAWKPTETPVLRKSGVDAASAGIPLSADTASAAARKLDDAASARIEASRRKSVHPKKSSADAASSLIDKPYPPRSPGERGGGDDSSANPLFLAAVRKASETIKCCERCEGPIAVGRIDLTNRKRFCSERCRKAAEHARRHQRRKDDGPARPIGDVINGNVHILRSAGGSL